MRGNHAFYSLAATLIPILLLGGILADRLRPPSQKPMSARHELVPPALTALISLAVMAEILAITAAEVGGNAFTAAVVVLALCTGLLAVSIAIVGPWVARVSPGARKSTLAGSAAV